MPNINFKSALIVLQKILKTTWCQENEENVVLEGSLKRVMAERDRA